MRKRMPLLMRCWSERRGSAAQRSRHTRCKQGAFSRSACGHLQVLETLEPHCSLAKKSPLHASPAGPPTSAGSSQRQASSRQRRGVARAAVCSRRRSSQGERHALLRTWLETGTAGRLSGNSCLAATGCLTCCRCTRMPATIPVQQWLEVAANASCPPLALVRLAQALGAAASSCTRMPHALCRLLTVLVTELPAWLLPRLLRSVR